MIIYDFFLKAFFFFSIIKLQAISKNGVGNPYVSTDKAFPVNNWTHGLFSQVDVSINGQMFFSSSNTYGYRVFIETQLSFGKACKKTFLTSSMWYKDIAGHMDSLGDVNVGARNRLLLTTMTIYLDRISYCHLVSQSRLDLSGLLMHLGTKIKDFKAANWKNSREEVMTNPLKQKFATGIPLTGKLKATAGKNS